MTDYVRSKADWVAGDEVTDVVMDNMEAGIDSAHVEIAALETLVPTAAVLKSVVDAAGDLIVGSGADAVTRLAKGTEGQWLRTVGGALVWETIQVADITDYVAPAMVMIEDQIVTTPTAGDFVFDNIPSTYKDLHLRFIGRSSDTPSSVAAWVRFNNDAVGPYDRQLSSSNLATVSGSESIAPSAIQVGSPTGAGAPAGVAGHIILDILSYASTVFQKTVRSYTSTKTVEASGGLWLQEWAGWWRSTAAINRVDIFPGSGNWIVGSRATLYGVR